MWEQRVIPPFMLGRLRRRLVPYTPTLAGRRSPIAIAPAFRRPLRERSVLCPERGAQLREAAAACDLGPAPAYRMS